MSYPFLSQPPPQKKYPLHSPPCIPTSPRRRSASSSAVTAWINQIHPGSPAPLSPHRRSPRSPRRPSTSARISSSSFLNLIDTPTTANTRSPSIHDFKADHLDLAHQGYATIFVKFPTTPLSAPIIPYPISAPAPSTIPIPPIPSSPSPSPKHKKSLTRLRSLSFRSASAMLSLKPKKPAHSHVDPVAAAARRKARSKSRPRLTGHTRYGHLRPLPLAADVQLGQLLDGGSLDCNVRRIMDAHAKGAGMPPGAIGGGVADMYRDAHGGLWWDQDEEWEFAHLIADDGAALTPSTPSVHGARRRALDDWVEFNQNEERRGSASTTCSTHSDLQPGCAVGALDVDDLVAFGGAIATRRPGASVLALPRPRRTRHMSKPAFLLDVFVPASSNTPTGTAAPRTPLGPAGTNASGSSPVHGRGDRARGPARRRPAPLTLTPPSPAFQRPSNSPADARRAFLDDSFAPAPVQVSQDPQSSPTPQWTPGAPGSPDASAARASVVKDKRSRLDMRGIFRLGGAKRSAAAAGVGAA